jgi:hypothetical protein
MHPQYQRLEEQIRQAIASHRWEVLLRGASIFLLTLLGGLGLLLLITRFDASPPIFRWLALFISLGAAAYVFAKYLLRPLRRTPTPQQVARHIEERHPDLEDRLATAVEFGDQPVPPLVQAMVRRLLNEVSMQTSQLNFARQVAVPYARMWKILSAVGTVALFFAIIVFFQPLRRDLSTIFASGSELIAGSLTVSPGDVSVRRGSAVTVEAQASESIVDKAVLYFSGSDTSWSSESMIAAEAGRFRYELFDLQDTVRYYVRAGDELSSIFKITPLDAPELRSIRLAYHYPASLGLSKKSTSGSGDIYGPEGTSVEVRAKFSDALRAASIQIGENAVRPARVLRDSILVADVEIKEDGFYRLIVSGANGIEGEPLEYFIRLLPDEPPVITLRRPGRDARVTMLEEVTIEAGVFEDFELQKFDVVYAVNNGAPQRVNLLPQARRVKVDDEESMQRDEFVASTLLYLEDFKVSPGDFISFYVEAADRRQSEASDIYFLEVRPFEEEFYMAVSQGGAGSMPNSLSISQKEIIVATWKLERERSRLAPDELASKSRAIAEAQRGVRDTIEQLRMMLSAQGDDGRMGEYFERAIDAMNRAEAELEAARLAEALPPEREAYNYLLKADAEVRRRDLQRGRTSSGAQAQSQEELQRLFADELDKMQSKYETLENNQRRSEERQVSEALEKVRELAQRQQQLNDLHRDLARQKMAEEERRRQIARLRREQENLARETSELERRMQNLSRQSEQNDPSRSSLAENLKQAANEMSRATNSLNRDNPESAAADGRRAVERLERLEDQLRRNASQSLQQRLSDLQQDFRRMADAQNRLADSLSQRGASADEEQRQQWRQTQERLRDRAGELAQRLRQAERSAAKDQPEVERGLNKSSETWQKSEIQNRMQQAENALENNRLDESERQQRQALRGLRNVEDELARVQSLLAESNDEKLDVALQQTQNLRRDLERQLQEQGNKSTEGSTPGSSREERDPSSSPTDSEAGRASRSQQQLNPEEMNWWRDRMWQALDQLDRMRPMVGGDSTLTESYSALHRELNGYVRTFTGGDAQRLADIENRIIDPLRRFEAEVATRLALAQQRQRLATAQDEQVPPGYRDMVDRYYEAIARSKRSVNSKQ